MRRDWRCEGGEVGKECEDEGGIDGSKEDTRESTVDIIPHTHSTSYTLPSCTLVLLVDPDSLALYSWRIHYCSVAHY